MFIIRQKLEMGYMLWKVTTEGKFWPRIRRGDILKSYHMSTLIIKMIWDNATLIMLKLG